MIVINQQLFYVNIGLLHCGAKAYDPKDKAMVALVHAIQELELPPHLIAWFAQARTGQVEVNPFWPRGSQGVVACFFLTGDIFPTQSYLDFIASTGVPDPIGNQEFRLWIAQLPKVLGEVAELPGVQALWEQYQAILQTRMSSWEDMLEEAHKKAATLSGDSLPKFSFAPNLFAIYSADYITGEESVLTIAASPDAESILHEVLHPLLTPYRQQLVRYAELHGLTGFADEEKMRYYGYLTDNSLGAQVRVLEECLVRALAVVLAGKGEERLLAHAAYGCSAVPRLAALFTELQPTRQNFGEFLARALPVESPG
ncbi:MAG: hypothetical protein FWF06_04775 [Symbiobacteriaceae bacterium]|nr:hypothetical protein [Symbiobacteriaceae bacterium]